MVAYTHAPIVEATVNLRLKAPIDKKLINRLENTNDTKYIFAQRDLMTNYEVNIAGEEVKINKIDTGVKLTSFDRADICIYRPSDFVCSRLAPYLGWQNLYTRARADWKRLKKIDRKAVVSRIGVRFINRIDVPKSTGPAKVEEYLNVWPRLPELGDSERIETYVMQIVRPAPLKCRLIINSVPAVSPMPGYDSFVLDLDLFREDEIPKDEEDLWRLVDEMREVKNDFFEKLITEKARSLFK